MGTIPDRRSIRSDLFWQGLSRSAHILQVYGTPTVFLDALEGFAGSGLRAEEEESVIVVASARHLHELEKRLRGRWIDIDRARWQGRYFPLLVHEVLGKVLVDGWPDEERFRRVVEKLIALARAGDRPVRLFVEMDAVGEQCGAASCMRLERLWSEVARDQQVPLFCAYSKERLEAGTSPHAESLRASHSLLLPG